MHIFNTRLLVLSLMWVALYTLGASSASAADMVAARSKVSALCQVCHGMDGVAILAEAANLSGQQRGYLVAQLRAYRSGSRKAPQMSIIAKSLTDADIENLAAWYSAIKVTVEPPK